MSPLQLSRTAPYPVRATHQQRGRNDRAAVRFILNQRGIVDAIDRRVNTPEISETHGREVRLAHIFSQTNQVLPPVDVGVDEPMMAVVWPPRELVVYL